MNKEYHKRLDVLGDKVIQKNKVAPNSETTFFKNTSIAQVLHQYCTSIVPVLYQSKKIDAKKLHF